MSFISENVMKKLFEGFDSIKERKFLYLNDGMGGGVFWHILILLICDKEVIEVQKNFTVPIQRIAITPDRVAFRLRAGQFSPTKL